MLEGARLRRRTAVQTWVNGVGLARAFARERPDRVALFALTLANVALIALLPVLGGHDLPQHLAYARILADYDDPRLSLGQTFTLPDGPQAYFTTYYLLAFLARATSLMTACRIVYAAYAIALPWGVASLVSAASEDKGEPAWSALLGPLFVWNPVACMGFLPFMLALPTMVFAAAALLRARRVSRNAVLLAFLCALLVSTHIVAAALVCAFALILLLSRPSRRAAALAAGVCSSTGLAYGAWSSVGPGHLARMPPHALADAMAKLGPWDGAAAAVGARWFGAAEKAGLLRATVLGCLPELGKSVVGLSLAVAAGVAVAARSACRPTSECVVCSPSAPPRPVSETRSTLRRALVGFAVLIALLPTSLSFPDDICLVDFRAMVVLALFGVAAIDPHVFDTLAARRTLVACATMVTGVWAFYLAGLSLEAEEVVSILQRLGPSDVLLALPFHDRSDSLDEANSATHYLPVYHTALNGGVTSLFWGKFSHHLPVGYRPGKEPLHPPDWKPWEVTRQALESASCVLVEWPDADDDEPAIVGAARLHEQLQRAFRPVECRSRWCLYRKDDSSSEPQREASRATRL